MVDNNENAPAVMGTVGEFSSCRQALEAIVAARTMSESAPAYMIKAARKVLAECKCSCSCTTEVSHG